MSVGLVDAVEQPAQRICRAQDHVRDRVRRDQLLAADEVQDVLEVVRELAQGRVAEEARRTLHGVNRTEDLVDQLDVHVGPGRFDREQVVFDVRQVFQ